MKEINLEKNIQLCFTSGFGTLVTARNDEDYRNAIISVYNGLELLMKFYLRSKNEWLIYDKITPQTILKKINNLRKNVNLKPSNTINYSECIKILKYFSELPEKNVKYLNQLRNKRNRCVHFEYAYEEKEVRKLLISHIYQFICDLISEMGLEPKTFIPVDNITSLDNYKKDIDDEIMQNYLTTIESARKHYLRDLTADERAQKAKTVEYTKRKFDIIEKCPSCENKALLRRKIQRIREPLKDDYITIRRDIILKDLSCHFCGLSITDYDQLKLEFKGKEKSFSRNYHLLPLYNDCPEDCPEYYDCRGDCPDGDCPDGDCPDGDCPDGDCPDGR